MIGNVITGKSFAGCARYVLEKEGSTLLSREFASDNVRGMVQEAAAHRSLNAKLTKECFHAVLSLHPDDKLSDEQWVTVAQRYMDGMGMANTPWFVAKHTDTDNPHVHIVGVRVDRQTGKTPAEWRSFEKSATIIQGIEKDYGLTPGALTPKQARELKVRPRTGPERALEARTGKECPRSQVQQALLDSLERSKTLTDLVVQLDDRGVRVVANVSPTTGRVSGLRYDLDEHSVKASQLGKAFGMSGLQKLVSYEPVRDLPTLFVAAEKEPSPELAAELGAARAEQGYRPVPGFPAPEPEPELEPEAPAVDMTVAARLLEEWRGRFAPEPDEPEPEPELETRSSEPDDSYLDLLGVPEHSAPTFEEPPPPPMPRLPDGEDPHGDPLLRLGRLSSPTSVREVAMRRFFTWRRDHPEHDPYRPPEMPPDMPYPPPSEKAQYEDPDQALRSLAYRQERELRRDGAVSRSTERAVAYHTWRQENPDRDPYRPENQPVRSRGDDFMPDR